ncbi:hypothetical protein ACWEOH_09615 [Agromyces sp. NPDC004153]
MTLRRALFALAAVAATITMSACVPGAADGGSPTPTASATSVPEPTPTPSPEPVAASITVSAEAIAVLDEGGGTLVSFDYFTPPTDVIAGLSTYLGAPVDSQYPGGLESAPGTVHEWGGLSIMDPDEPDAAAPYSAGYWVHVTTPDANGFPVSTPAGIGSPSGVRVGDPFTSVTILDEPVVEWTDADGRPKANARVGLVPLPPVGEYGDAPSFGITVVGATDDDEVTYLVAPSANWGV